MLEQQQWQMKAMAEELAALQQGRISDKGKSEGKPVQAAFKDGLVFEDGSGDRKLQLNGRIQADYRSFEPTEWKNDGFFIRRARLGGTFTFLKDISVRVEGEYSNLSDGYIGFSTSAGSTLTQTTEANGVTFFSVSGLGAREKRIAVAGVWKARWLMVRSS